MLVLISIPRKRIFFLLCICSQKTISKKILSSKILDLKENLGDFFQQREEKQSGQRAAGGEFFAFLQNFLFPKQDFFSEQCLISQKFLKFKNLIGFFFGTISYFPKNLKFLSSKILEIKRFLATKLPS